MSRSPSPGRIYEDHGHHSNGGYRDNRYDDPPVGSKRGRYDEHDGGGSSSSKRQVLREEGEYDERPRYSTGADTSVPIEAFYDPQKSPQSMLNRTLIIRNKPDHMTDFGLQEFLNRAMQSVKLCNPYFFPIVRCERVRGNDGSSSGSSEPNVYAILCRNERNANLAMYLNGIPVPDKNNGGGDHLNNTNNNGGNDVILEVSRHSRYDGKPERPKHWTEALEKFKREQQEQRPPDEPQSGGGGQRPINKEDYDFRSDPDLQNKFIFVGNLALDVDAGDLLKFLDETMVQCGLSNDNASPPLFTNCNLRMATEKDRQYAIIEIRSIEEGIQILHLNRIPYHGQNLLIKTAWTKVPNPKNPDGNWNDTQRRLGLEPSTPYGLCPW